MTETDTYSAFMLDYASGALPAPLMLAGEIHVALSENGRSASQVWDVVGGALMEEGVPASSERAAIGTRKSLPSLSAHEVIDRPTDQLNWRRSLLKTEFASVPMKHCRYLRIPPGISMPRHGHRHFEATVVLEGAFEDELGVYEVGDISLAEPGLRHTPKVVGDQPCVCFVAKEPRRFGGVFDSLVGRFQ